jgi:hypothetical protein
MKADTQLINFKCRGRDSNFYSLVKCWPGWKSHINHHSSNSYANSL